jgi:hypothetical protein
MGLHEYGIAKSIVQDWLRERKTGDMDGLRKTIAKRVELELGYTRQAALEEAAKEAESWETQDGRLIAQTIRNLKGEDG